jgi:hypothetical protein
VTNPAPYISAFGRCSLRHQWCKAHRPKELKKTNFREVFFSAVLRGSNLGQFGPNLVSASSLGLRQDRKRPRPRSQDPDPLGVAVNCRLEQPPLRCLRTLGESAGRKLRDLDALLPKPGR